MQGKRSAQPCREKVRKGFKELMLQLEFAIWMRENNVPGRGDTKASRCIVMVRVE